MTPVPLDLPVRPAEAAELAILIFDQAERKALTGELRNRLASRASTLRLETVAPYFGSLERDPIHPSTYYLAIDGPRAEPLLLHIALAAAPTSSIFHKPILIGRMRRPNGPEMVINALPFGPSDHDNLDKFAARAGPGFLPRPQGARSAIAVTAVPLETALPAAFEAWRAILKGAGKNLAAIGSGRPAYYAGLWAAIRAGWRDEYSASAEITLGAGLAEDPRETIRRCAACTRFVVDPSQFFLREAALEEQFDRSFNPEQRGWIFEEFARRFDLGDVSHELAERDVLRLAVRFGPALLAAEQAHEWIRQTRSTLKTGRAFDFEFSLERSAAPTLPADLLFCLHWLKTRSHAAQLVAPNLGEHADLAARLKDLAAVSRHYQSTLSIASHSSHTPADLSAIGRATRGRFLYRLTGDIPGAARHVQYIAAHLLT